MQTGSETSQLAQDSCQPQEEVDELVSEDTMTDQQRVNVYVRTILCGEGRFFFDHKISTLVRRFKCGVSAAQDGQMTTWIPTNAVPVLMVGTSSRENIIITCQSGDSYNMSHALGVPSIHAGVVLMCNCTVNFDGSFTVLVYDGENIPIWNATTGFADPGDSVPTSVERYQRLRDYFPYIFNASETSTKIFMIQWVGYYEYACKFLSGEIMVPHAISGLLSLTEDPLTPSRPVRVKLPNLVIKRFQEPA